VKKFGESMFWKKILRSFLAIVGTINTLRLRYMWEQRLCIHFFQTLFLSTCSASSAQIFDLHLLLQEDKRQLNFQDLSMLLVSYSSDRNSFLLLLCLINKRVYHYRY